MPLVLHQCHQPEIGLFGLLPLLTIIPVRSQWGHHNSSRIYGPKNVLQVNTGWPIHPFNISQQSSIIKQNQSHCCTGGLHNQINQTSPRFDCWFHPLIPGCQVGRNQPLRGNRPGFDMAQRHHKVCGELMRMTLLLGRWMDWMGSGKAMTAQAQFHMLPFGYVKIAIENGHRNSGFTH